MIYDLLWVLQFGKSCPGKRIASSLTIIIVCLRCHFAPAVLPRLLPGWYEKILHLSVRETQQDCEGDQICFRKKNRSSSSSATDTALMRVWARSEEEKKTLQTISCFFPHCLICRLRVTNNANNFRFYPIPGKDHENSHRLALEGERPPRSPHHLQPLCQYWPGERGL